jgi:hypothetical protein
MFMTKWEDKFCQKGEDHQLEKPTLIQYVGEVPNFFSGILLTQNETEPLNETVKKYLARSKFIWFELHSNAMDISWRHKLNRILQECQEIKEVKVDLQKMLIQEAVEFNFLPTLGEIKLIIANAIFDDCAEHKNMISVFGPNKIEIEFSKCRFAISRLIAFADYVNEHSTRFKQINFRINNDSILVGVDNVVEFKDDIFSSSASNQFSGKLRKSKEPHIVP